MRIRLPPELEELRQHHDPMAPFGVPAHVTLLYPFLPSADLTPAVRRRIARLTRDVRPFDVGFEKTGRFPGVVWLAHEPAEPFVALTELLAAAFPDHPPYEGAHDEIVPHLTLGLGAEGVLGRVARSVRAGPPFQERVRAIQKHHLLMWARDSARILTHQAQQQGRLHEKIAGANRALECIDTALKSYPDNEDLQVSATAVRDFMTSSRVAHWVELAQRATFKGRYRRAIDCYRDALFYLTRAGSEHQLAAEQITREIELLRARMSTSKAVEAQPVNGEQKHRLRSE